MLVLCGFDFGFMFGFRWVLCGPSFGLHFGFVLGFSFGFYVGFMFGFVSVSSWFLVVFGSGRIWV